MDRHPCRPCLRCAFAAPRIRGSVWLRRFAGEVRKGLRGGMDEGDERRSLRSRLTVTYIGWPGSRVLGEDWFAADAPRELDGYRAGTSMRRKVPSLSQN